MLKDVRLFDRTGILVFMGQNPNRVEEGIYEGCFSLDNCFPFRMEFEDRYPQNLARTSYGVADTLDQVKDFFKKEIEDTERSYVLSVVTVKKNKQPPEGGRRRHKRGDYIGTKKPQFEYLYDEGEDIQEVVCFHIYDITNYVS